MGEIGGLIASGIVVLFFVLLVGTVIGNLLLTGWQEMRDFFKSLREIDESAGQASYDQTTLDRTVARQKARELNGEYADRVAADVLSRRAAKRRAPQLEDMGFDVDEECDALAARMAVDAR
jgi:hypothetical protein